MTRRIPRNSLLTVLAFLLSALPVLPASAQVQVADVFSNHMVLQRQMPIPVWGSASPGEPVTIRLGGDRTRTRADERGRWMARLSAHEAGGPHVLTISGRADTVTFTDVLIGEVWLCSGQSNMEMGVQETVRKLERGSDNAAMEVGASSRWDIRLLHLPRRISGMPRRDLEAGWTRSDSESVGVFSAVGYFFGRELHRELGVPVGLIDATWGGTRIEPWTPPEGFSSVPELTGIAEEVTDATETYLEQWNTLLPTLDHSLHEITEHPAATGDWVEFPVLPVHPLEDVSKPTALYNGMIHPLVPYAIRGAIWYQGEANRHDGSAYRAKMEALIGGWRTVWGQEHLPFYFVQLAPYRYGEHWEVLPAVREAQRKALAIPHTGMAVTTDVGNLRDIHPTQKQTVAHRLARWARAQTYGEHALVYSGPLFREVVLDDGRVQVQFTHTGSGLATRDNQPLIWFELAGSDGVFRQARAEIRGNAVVLWHPAIPAPDSIRYGWDETAQPYLINNEGLPASPFRGAVLYE